MNEIITVGGSKGRFASDLDARWDDGPSTNPGSNFGPSIDLFAPADRVLTAHWSSVTATRDASNNAISSGTSFAAPLVAGVAARLLEFYPTENGDQIRNRLVLEATSDIHGLNMTNRGAGSPNLMIFMYTHCKRRSA